MDQLLNILWTLLIYAMVFGILWWMLNAISQKITAMAPFLSIAWVILIVAAGAVAIAILIGRLPLIPFLHFGSLG